MFDGCLDGHRGTTHLLGRPVEKALQHKGFRLKIVQIS